MNKFLLTLICTSAFAASGMAADTENTSSTKTSTGITTGVSTEQDSGVTLSDKAKVMPNSTITTGDNTSSTDIDTSVENDSKANASSTRLSQTESNNNNENGRGHKYGHYKD